MARPGPKEARHRLLPDDFVSVAFACWQGRLTHENMHAGIFLVYRRLLCRVIATAERSMMDVIEKMMMMHACSHDLPVRLHFLGLGLGLCRQQQGHRIQSYLFLFTSNDTRKHILCHLAIHMCHLLLLRKLPIDRNSIPNH
jgi:hypothetical protein